MIIATLLALVAAPTPVVQPPARYAFVNLSVVPMDRDRIVVLDRNPLSNIRNMTSIRYVMKTGVLYRGETLDQVWPKAVPLHQPWWSDERPPMAGSLPHRRRGQGPPP